MRPQAELSNLTGVYERRLPGEPPYLRFAYQVVRVRQLPPELLLNGGPGTLPLAPISAVTAVELPGVIGRMRERIRRERSARLWTATYILMGLRYPRPVVEELLQGVLDMEESMTYQAILTKGEAKGIAEGWKQGALEQLRKTLLLLGGDRFGAPSARAAAAVEAIEDIDRLQELAVRVLHATGWEELLGSPRRPPRRRK